MPIKLFEARQKHDRVDLYLSSCFPHLSRSLIERWIKDNRVLVNGIPVKKNASLQPGDRIEVNVPDADPDARISDRPDYRPSFQIKKLYEDNRLLVIDKPSGITVHPGAGSRGETVLDVFRWLYPQVDLIPDSTRPGIVHRLDRDTSGILILAKDAVCFKQMQKIFKRREIRKTYLALVSGRMRYQNGTFDAPLVRHRKKRNLYTVSRKENEEGARPAVTEYSLIFEFPDFSYIRLHPLTGRTHQIRVHLRHNGTPILGDPLYGDETTMKRLALHASSVAFPHPESGNRITVNSPPPPEFLETMRGNFPV